MGIKVLVPFIHSQQNLSTNLLPRTTYYMLIFYFLPIIKSAISPKNIDTFYWDQIIVLLPMKRKLE